MDNFSEMFNKLISDPAIMNAVSEIAASVSGDNTSPEENGTTENTEQPSNPIQFDIGSILGSLSSAVGDQTALSSSRAELLRALKPFVNRQRSAQIDKALSMLNTASAAKAALKAFGSKKLF